MGILFDDAHDKARKASVAAARAKSAMQQSAHLMADMERRLHHISQTLPANTPARSLAPMLRTMRNVQHHAEQTLQHLRKLDTHVRDAESRVGERRHE